MIIANSKNRKTLKDYLSNLKEDDFIENIVIPLFNKNGYLLYRINSHGPGEHGKDIIFYRHVPIFYDHEFLIVQAKSEKITTNNVSKHSQQLVRALRVPFPTKTGTTNRQANYVIFINSKEHSNDVSFEFPYLIEGSNNIKILSQENVVELILTNNFIPDDLEGKIEKYDFKSVDYEQEIRNILFSNDPEKVHFLLNTRLEVETRQLSKELKELIINFIFNKWEEDRSWAGTVMPMKWLNQYFDFIQENQYDKLFQVIEEYASSTPSFDAYYDTTEVTRKIRPQHIKAFEVQFLELIANNALNYNIIKKYPILYDKLKEYYYSDLVNPKYKTVCKTMIDLIELIKTNRKKKGNVISEEVKDQIKEKREEIFRFLGLE